MTTPLTPEVMESLESLRSTVPFLCAAGVHRVQTCNPDTLHALLRVADAMLSLFQPGMPSPTTAEDDTHRGLFIALERLETP